MCSWGRSLPWAVSPMNTYTYTYMFIYIYIYIYMHTCIDYIYIYIYMFYYMYTSYRDSDASRGRRTPPDRKEATSKRRVYI